MLGNCETQNVVPFTASVLFAETMSEKSVYDMAGE
jgi:hypothetical protein